MTKDDLIVGHYYEAKYPKIVDGGYINDREVLAFDNTRVWYTNVTIPKGKHCPTTSMEKFLQWVGRDVTEEMPEDGWRK